MTKFIKLIKDYHTSVGIDPRDGKLHYNELRMMIIFSLIIIVVILGIVLFVVK
jgi:hypothetical protein